MAFFATSSESRTEAPRDARAATARAAGLGPRAELVGFSAAWLCVTGAAWLWAGRLTQALQNLLHLALATPTQGAPVSPLAFWSFPWSSRLVVPIAGMFAFTMACMLCAQAMAQGFTFRLWRSRHRRRFEPPGRTRWVSALLASVMLAIAVGGVLPSTLRASLRAEPGSLQALGAELGLRLSVVLVLLALVDTWLARAAFWRSLWMTRRERRAEDREAHGTPEARTARAEARRRGQAEAGLRGRA